MSSVSGDKDLLLYIGVISSLIEENVTREIVAILSELKTYIRDEKLSGQALNIRSGNLRNSVKDEIQSARDQIIGTISATGVSDKGFPYGYVHEYNLGAYKIIKDHSYMRSSLKENEEMIMSRINQVIQRAIYANS
jgi:hypothetical protein